MSSCQGVGIALAPEFRRLPGPSVASWMVTPSGQEAIELSAVN